MENEPRKQASKQSGLAPRECPTCGASFQPYRDFQIACSRNCRDRLPGKQETRQAYHARPDVRERKNAARRVGADPGRREKQLRELLKRRYGLSLEQYEQMLDRQGGQCAICGSPPDPNGVRASSRLHVDHDHVTGRNRELLCTRCNQGVGYFRDDPELLRAAAQYIERHRDGA